MIRVVMALVLLASVGYGAVVIAITARWERKWRSAVRLARELEPGLIQMAASFRMFGISARKAGESFRAFGKALEEAVNE